MEPLFRRLIGKKALLLLSALQSIGALVVAQLLSAVSRYAAKQGMHAFIAAEAAHAAAHCREPASTFCVQASDCWRSVAMVAAAVLLLGRTENLFSSCISSFRASLSVLSFSMAALKEVPRRSVINSGVETLGMPSRLWKPKAARRVGARRVGSPLLYEELLRLCEHTVLRVGHSVRSNIGGERPAVCLKEKV